MADPWAIAKFKGLIQHDGNLFSLYDWMELFFSEPWCVSRGVVLVALYVGLFAAAAYTMPFFIPLVAGWILGTLPIWAPVAAAITFWYAWVWFVRSLFLYKRFDPVLLEVRVPREITKSPRAMEQVYANLWIRMSETTIIDKYWAGGSRPYFSFEIASFGGDVRFFIWARRDIKNVIEANMYAQYPEVEIVEAEDYASRFRYNPALHECFVSDYRLVVVGEGPAPTDYIGISALPIRSYVDFELDRDPKDEHKVDPFAQVVETLSSVKPGEQMWIQMIIRAHLSSEWKRASIEAIENIRVKAMIPPGKTAADLENDPDILLRTPHPTPVHREQMDAITRHVGKLPFEVGTRSIYVAQRGKLDGHLSTAMRWIYRPFANPNFLTMYRPARGHNIFDFPWQDFHNWRAESHTKRWLDAYRRRQWFHPPMVVPFNVFSTESLATLWHPPSTVVRSPGLTRLPSTKAEPPPNLPR